MSVTADLRQYRELFVNLTQRELKGKYKRTILGQLWSLANPLALMLVYTLVFGFIIRIGPERGDPSGLDVFPLWLLCGLLPWIFFATVVTQGMSTLISNESLIKKVYFPRSVLVFSSGASIALNWSIEMGVLLIALAIAGAWAVFLWIPAILVLMLLLAAFAIGVALALSIANVYFRDTQYFMTILLQLGLYLSPVVYPMSLVQTQSDRVGALIGPLTLIDIYRANPLVSFLSAFRSVMYDNAWPEVSDTIACVVWAAIALLVGVMVFRRSERRLAEIL